MDLTEFLRARLDEDEQAALRCGVQLSDGKLHLIGDGDTITIDARRVLAEVEAKRKLLGSHYDYRGVCTRCFDWQNKPVEREQFPCEVVRLLALPYADHPDYRAEWRP